MKFCLPPTLASLILCSSVFVSSVLGARTECGTTVTDEENEAMIKELKQFSPIKKRQDGQTYNFGIYFNIVASNLTVAGGWVPQKQIDDQMALLNEKWVGTGISYNLLGVTRILSRYWHETVDAGLPQTEAMHQLFHKGGSTTLNVYSVGFYDAGLNGYSTLPSSYRTAPHRDGIVLFYATLPGGSSRERQGGTLVHEAGHWCGLRHTFQGGCTGTGDGVDDTPPSAEANYGCPIGLDSCIGDSFPDPIHNYMDYTDEICRTEFTPGQIDLMHRSLATWRSDPKV